MSSVDIDDESLNIDATQSNALASKPITMEDLVNIPVERPLMKHEGLKWVARKYTQPRACYSTEILKCFSLDNLR